MTYEAIKVGDTVTINVSYRWNLNYQTAVVTKVTATQIVCGASRYRRHSGIEVGGSYGSPRIVIGEEADDLVRNTEIARRVRRLQGLLAGKFDVNRKSVDALRAAAAEIEAHLRNIGEWEPPHD